MIAMQENKPKNTKKPVVLIVDDEPRILDALEDLLEDDFEVVAVSRGEDALPLLEQRRFSVVLSDQRMPGINGDVLLQEAKLRSDATRILVTGYSDISAVVRAVNNGQIYAYVSKPWKAGDMKMLVHKAADHHCLRRRYLQQTELLDGLMNQFPDHIYFKDQEGRFLRGNRSFAQALGLEDASQLVGTRHLDWLADEQREAYHQEDLEVLGEGKVVLDRHQRITVADGRTLWMSVTKLPLDGTGLVCVARDISEQRRMATEREVFFLNTSDLIMIIGFDKQVKQLNPAWERTLGWSRADLESRELRDLIHPDDRVRFAAEERKLVNQGGYSTSGFENRWLHKNGTYRWLMWTMVAVQEEKHVYAAARDITRRKEEEQNLVKLVRKQRYLSELTQLALAGVELSRLCDEAVKIARDHLQLDCSGVFRDEDGELQMIAGVGYPTEFDLDVLRGAPEMEEAMSSGRMMICSDFKKEDPLLSRQALLAMGMAAGGGVPLMDSKSAPWGALQVLSRAPRLFSEEDLRFLDLIADILSLEIRKRGTQKELEVSQQRLLQSQKLEAIGRMAGGIAHDFNNILTIVCANVEQFPPSEETRDIFQATGAATRLIQRLLTFARQQPLNSRPVELNEALGSDERLLRRLVSEEIELTVIRSEQQAWTLIDPDQLTQVLANLVSNARDAIEGHGEITISVREAIGGQVGLEVRDTGGGMSPEIVERIFQPFFTTKPIGRGTGLGLATAYGSVCQSGGTLAVSSQLGAGTCFTILLPTTSERPGPIRAVTRSDEPKVAHETVLLVDDEEPIVRLFGRVLGKAGYRVHTATSSTAAAERARTMAEPIDVLISDTVMPDMGGHELAAKVLEYHPGVKILLTSGYSEKAADSEGVVTRFLAKPYSAKELLAALRDLLDN